MAMESPFAKAPEQDADFHPRTPEVSSEQCSYDLGQSFSSRKSRSQQRQEEPNCTYSFGYNNPYFSDRVLKVYHEGRRGSGKEQTDKPPPVFTQHVSSCLSTVPATVCLCFAAR